MHSAGHPFLTGCPALLFPLFSIGSFYLGVSVGVATLVRKAAKPLAMVGVTGLLSVGMISMSSNQAEADAGLIAAPIIEGATEAILPEVMATEASVGPVGWALLGLTVLAASTQDYWMPWVAGQFGIGNANVNNAPAAGTQYPGYSENGTHVTALKGMSLAYVNPNAADRTKMDVGVNIVGYNVGSSASFHVAYRLVCHMDVAGDNTDPGGTTWTANSFWVQRQAALPGSWTFSPVCTYSNAYGNHYGTPVQLRAGMAGDAGIPNLPADPFYDGYTLGPTNDLQWGNGTTQNFDPKSSAVKFHTSVECIAKDGTKATITADSSGGAIKVPSCAAAGLGRATGKIDITSDNPNQTGQKMFHQSAPTTDTAHPLCDPTLAGPLCKLQILIDGKPCVEGQTECIRWAQLAKSDPARVQCWYGPYQVAMSNCNMLERAYEVGGAPSNVPNTDGDPTTRSGAGPDGNPETGTDPNGNPDPSVPRSGPGTIAPPVPGVGGQPGPNADQDSKDCFPTGWGMLNPVEWVFKPTQCALKWAFVPDTATMTDLQTKVQTDIDHVGFGPAQAAVVGMFAPLGNGGSGCQGPPITFAMDGQSQTIYPFQACQAPMSIAAGICNALFTLAFTVGGGLALLRAVGSAFGYNFSFGRGAGAEA